MDTTVLQKTYQVIEASVKQARFLLPTDQNEWPVEYVLAHIIATNRTLCIVGTRLLDDNAASYEGGTVSVSPHWLAAVIETSGSMDGLLTIFHQSYEELLALAHKIDDETASKQFPAVIYDGHGRILLDGPISFSTLMTNLLVRHLSDHTQQIHALQAL